MKKEKLIFYGFCLFAGGIRLELLKCLAAKRLEHRIKRNKSLSDYASIVLSKKIDKKILRLREYENAYADLYNEIKFV